MRRALVSSLVAALLALAACQTNGDAGMSGSFRSNGNKALTDDPYAAASK